jgi:RimJ/RimL family protein N-acetyltransferase
MSDRTTGEWPAISPELVLRNWRALPPVIRGTGVVLREVQIEDAPALLTALAPSDLTRVVAQVSNAMEVAHRIEAARLERSEGRGLCLAVVTEGSVAPAGVFRLRETEPGFGAAQWDFALAREYWGQGLFFRVAPLVVDFVFDVLGAHRLEARASLSNARCHGALRKLGALQEAVLRQSERCGAGYQDQVLWTLLADQWRARTGRPRQIH